jgi:hypothetical protein
MRRIHNAKRVTAKCREILADKLLDVAFFHSNLFRSVPACSFRFQRRRSHAVHSDENTEVKRKHALKIGLAQTQDFVNTIRFT